MTAPSLALDSRAPARWQRLIAPVLTPDLFDFWASRVHPTLSWQRPMARVVERRQESADAVTLVLKPNRHWRGFRAGQHLNLTLEIDGVRVTRSYSLSDAPRAHGRIAITVKAIESGRVSQHLFRATRVGDVVEIAAAFGEMAVAATPTHPIALLAAGSGITPLMAMLRGLAAEGMPVPVSLLYWARTRDEFCFAEELRALAAKHPQFRVKFFVTRQPATAADESEGRLGADAIATIADWDQRDVFACGPGGFTDLAKSLIGQQARSFAFEAFTPPPRQIEETGNVDIVLTRSGRTLTVARGQSLLSALEAQGLKPAYGCRRGICNTCACGKASGTTTNLDTGDVQREPVSALKLCINTASTDLILDL